MISNIKVDSVAFAQHQNNDSYSTLPGNIIPHSWYGEIVSDSGNTDFNAITILSEIVYWYTKSYFVFLDFPIAHVNNGEHLIIRQSSTVM